MSTEFFNHALPKDRFFRRMVKDVHTHEADIELLVFRAVSLRHREFRLLRSGLFRRAGIYVLPITYGIGSSAHYLVTGMQIPENLGFPICGLPCLYVDPLRFVVPYGDDEGVLLVACYSRRRYE